MFAVYAKDEDMNLACSDRYQKTEFLGIYSTLELAKEQIENHEVDIRERINNNTRYTPELWYYYIYSCEIDKPVIMNEQNVVYSQKE